MSESFKRRGAPRHATRPRVRLPRAIASLALGFLLLALRATAAGAVPGSGDAIILPSSTVVAGATGTWNVTYAATENFANSGGMIEVVIPAGWTQPQRTSPTSPGYVAWTDTSKVDSVVISGHTIRVYLGAPPKQRFRSGDAVSVLYGVGGGLASARAQTAAPASVAFQVLSDPEFTGSPAPLASSPSLSVVPGPVASVRVVDATLAAVGALARTTDQDTTHLYLRGYDAYGNSARFVSGTWGVTGGIGVPIPASGTGTVLALSSAGTGYAVGDSGSWADSTGLITVTHGTYQTLTMTSAASGTAGEAFAVTGRARDADGNTITSGAGSLDSFTFLAYADSTGTALADPEFVAASATLSAGTYSGTLIARGTGTYYLAAIDSSTGFISERHRVVVSPAPPDRLILAPDTLRLTAGVPDTVTVRVVDGFDNPAPLASPQTLTLWTDRPAGSFRNLSGGAIYEITLPTGADSARFLFRDTQTTSSAGRIRAMDADGSSPFLGTAASNVLTIPAAPAGPIVLTAFPDTLVANGADSTLVVSGVVRDAFGNSVAASERFILDGGVLLTPTTDQDPGAPGAQLLADAAGEVRGYLRVGAVSGVGSATMVSERGSPPASGAASILLLSGTPAGVIALSSSADSLAADSVATLAISAAGLEDANGNQVQDGEAYTVATALGEIASADQDAATPGVQRLSLGGSIAFTLFGGDSLGTAHVTAASVRGSASGNLDIRLVPGGVSASRSSVAAVSPVPVGAPGSAITVTLRDSQGHALSGVPADSITVTITGAVATVTALAAATDADGGIDFGAAATIADTGQVLVRVRGIPLDARPGLVFEHGPLDHYTVSGPAGPVTSGVGFALALAAFDAYGNPLPDRNGDVLRPTVLAGGAIVPDSVLLAGGVATVAVTPTLAAALTVRVSDVSSRSVTHGPVAVLPGAPYRVVASPAARDTLAAGDSIAVGALLTDLHGNATPGGLVAASIPSGSGSIVPGSDPADGSGIVDFMVHAGSAPGALLVRFHATGSAAPDSARADSLFFTVVAAGAAQVAVGAPPNGAAGDSLPVTLTLLDAFGNRAISATPSLWLRTTTAAPSPDHVTWITGATAQGALQDSASSDGARYTFAPGDSGRVTLLLRDTRVETIRARASGAGILPAESGELAIGAASPSAIAILSGDGQSGIVARDLAQPLRAQVRDAFGNAAIGANVVFRVLSGGGYVDAVRGGAPDSIGIADAGGVVVCEVARLGTLAGIGTDSFIASLSAIPATAVTFVASALPDTAASLSIAPGSIALAPSQAAAVTVTARDLFGNLAPATPLTIYLGSPIAGSLESLGSTSGGPGSQSGVSDAAGQITVRYRAPAVAPAADSVFARGSFVAPVGIRAATSPGQTTSLRVAADSLAWTAGVPERVRVQAIDAFGNLASSDGAIVTMRPSGSVTWSPASGALVAGEFVAFARDTVAETIAIGADRVGGGSGAGGVATVGPGAPAGAISVAATRDTLTADGGSASTVTLGPLRDAFGNLAAAGALIGVSTLTGTILASDASALYPGLDLAVGADGMATLLLVAPTAPGRDTLAAASRQGNASGRHAFTYVPPPSLAYVVGSLAPAAVLPGANVTFSLRVANTGAGPIRLEAGSTLSFGAGAATFDAALAAPVLVAAGATSTLALSPSSVPASLVPGVYAPSFHAVGTDGTGARFDFYLSLSGAQVSALGIAVAAVGASPDPAPLGLGSLDLVFDVTNRSGTQGALVGGSLSYSIGAFTSAAPVAPALPATIPAGGTARFTLAVRVPASGIPSGTIVGVRLHATMDFGGAAVVDSNATELSFGVVSAARVAAVSGSTSPPRFLRGRTAGPSVRVANTGASTVTLTRGTTRLVLDRGADVLAAGLSANAVVAAGDLATLAFDSLATPGVAPKGRYRARLFLDGFESGQAFSDTIPLAPDSMEVLDPALLSVVAGTLVPDTLSAGQARPLSLSLRNGGDVPFTTDPATTLRLAAPLSVARALGSGVTIGAGQTLTLAFSGGALGSSSAPGAAVATLEVFGQEDGVPRSQALFAGTLVAEPPAALLFVAGSTSPALARAGSTVDFTLQVRNAGGSPFTLDPATSRLTVSDGVDVMTALSAGAPFVLAPGAAAILSFPGTAIPVGMASQVYRVDLALQGSEWGLPESASAVSPDGEFTLLDPAAAIQVRGMDAGAPIQVAPGAGPTRVWGLEFTPLTPPGATSRSSLTTLRLSVSIDGQAGVSPAAAVASIALRDPSGTILAQAAPLPGAPNPVTLSLPAALSLAGGAESLFVEIALQPGAEFSRMALGLDGATDVIVLDDLTSTLVPVVGGGGLAFAALVSPDLTLFARAHGYPNPFHAGGEAVRLSYVLSQDAPVKVSIYTLLGDLVREISVPAGGGGGASGLNEVPWDGRNGAGDLVRPGVYVARIEGGGVSALVKVGVLR